MWCSRASLSNSLRIRRKAASHVGAVCTHPAIREALQPRTFVGKRGPINQGQFCGFTSGQQVLTRIQATGSTHDPQNQQKKRSRRKMPTLKKLNRVSDVLGIHKYKETKMSPKNISRCWSRIATIVSRNEQERAELRRRSRDVQLLLQHTIHEIKEFGADPLSLLVHSLAKVSIRCRYNIDRKVWRVLEHRTVVVLDDVDMSPRRISNVAWAFAKVRYRSTALFDKIAQASVPKMSMFNPQDLSNLALAYATAEHSAPLLFDAIADASLEQLDKFNPQDLSNIAWAFAAAGHTSPLLFNAIADASRDQLDDFTPQNLSIMAWAFASAGHSAPTLFGAIAGAALPMIHSFNPQDLSNILWACATIGQPSPFLFDVIAKAALPQLNRFNPHNLANIAWAYATVDRSAPWLFNAIAESALPRIDSFDPQALAKMAWACATVKHSAPPLFDGIAGVAISRLDHFSPHALSNMAWAYATARHSAPLLFDEMTKTARARLDSFTPQNLSIMAWSYAAAGHSAPLLFDAMADAAVSRLDSFSPQDLSHLLLSFANAGHLVPSLFDATGHVVLSKLDDFNAQELCDVLWAFAVCDHPCESLMNDNGSSFTKAFNANDAFLSLDALIRLHQVHLWCLEHGSSSLQLDFELQKRCLDAFVEQREKPSELQKDVIKTLSDLGLDPIEDVQTGFGYTLDAVVRYRDQDVAIEVDVPHRFLSNHSPTGSTILRHRQLSMLENYRLLSVPYWEWHQVAMEDSTSGCEKRKTYLTERLDGVVES